MAELSPSSSGSHLRVAPASPLAISNERTDERTTEVSDDCGIPELSDVRARVTDFNKVEANNATVYRVVYGAPFPGWRDFTDHAQAIAFAETAIATPPATIHTIETEPTA